jgi:hypothetical protein
LVSILEDCQVQKLKITKIIRVSADTDQIFMAGNDVHQTAGISAVRLIMILQNQLKSISRFSGVF